MEQYSSGTAMTCDLQDQRTSSLPGVALMSVPRGIMETIKIAKHVSSIVDADEQLGNCTVKLESKTWINGLCFFAGERKFPFVFKWPESLSE